MSNFPWFTAATLLVALAQAAAGLSGSVEPEVASAMMTASIVLGGLGKALYNIGEGLKIQLDDSELES